jgi:site-specific DNA-methyltransferase (cytosine-N4-specific)
VIRANSRNLPLADNSVDLVVTSPPYFALRSYQDGGEHYAGQIGDEPTPAEFVDSLLEVTAECVRVLKPSGSLWVNLGDKYANPAPSGTAGKRVYKSGEWDVSHTIPNINSSATIKQKSLIGIPWRYALRCIDDLGLILRAEVIWSKPNGLPESVTDRVRRSHEQWFHFTIQPRYFANLDPIRLPTQDRPGMVTWADRVAGKGRSYSPDNGHNAGGAGMAPNVAGKLPPSVWDIATEPLTVPDHLGVDHFAAFPTEWPKRIIQGWSPEGGTVLDPFGGTGTTAMVAKALGRHGISVDMSADYCRLAEWRTNDRDQLAKVLGVAKVEQQDDAQESLFDVGPIAPKRNVSVSLQGDRTCQECGYRSQYARKPICDKCGAPRSEGAA